MARKKLTWAKVEEIRRLYKPPDGTYKIMIAQWKRDHPRREWTYKKLAQRFKVSMNAIYSALAGKTWVVKK
jgi:hypothetical protein